MKIIPVILSGGSGTRLWPLSRKQYPKQFLALDSQKSLLQETILRLNGVKNIESPIIVCNINHRFIVAEQLNEIDVLDSSILLEPVGRNTAPAIAAAAKYVTQQQKKDKVILIVLSADHLIRDIKAFHNAINVAIESAKKEKIVTFGVIPTEANIGYGYIKTFAEKYNGTYKVESFEEKPDQITANQYLEKGNYLWNSGMFVLDPHVLLKELSIYSNDILNLISLSVTNAKKDMDFIRLEAQSFIKCPNISIDYAIMEKSHKIVAVPLDAGWNDIGSWQSLHDEGARDKKGNVTKGDVYLKDTSNSYIHSSSRFIATIGIDNLIIIDTPDALLVSTKEKTHLVKNIPSKLNKEGRSEHDHQRKVYRPWGWYDSIESGKNFQVKRLHVKQQAKLSLQMHLKRAEHWVVVSGTATVTNGDKVFKLKKGESTFIPIGVKHSLANYSKQPLEIIEVQSGIYLGEDDIVRYEDIYGRIKE
jgi:mannose-1-phosphate guanylyltransferase/mannose-6-phosphate isomerase